MLKLRKAQLADAEIVHQIRNDNEVLRYSFNSSPISFEQHLAWFNNTISNPSRYLLVLENEHQIVGVLRYDFDGDFKEAEVSIFLEKKSWGKGFGRHALASGEQEIKKNFPTCKKIKAKVFIENKNSLMLFEKSGFVPLFLNFEKEVI